MCRHPDTWKPRSCWEAARKLARRNEKKGEKDGGNKMLWQGGGGGGNGIKERKAHCTMGVCVRGGLVPDRCRFEPGVEHRCFGGWRSK